MTSASTPSFASSAAASSALPHMMPDATIVRSRPGRRTSALSSGAAQQGQGSPGPAKTSRSSRGSAWCAARRWSACGTGEGRRRSGSHRRALLAPGSILRR